MKNAFEDYCGEGSSFQTFLTLVRYPMGISLFLLPWAMKFGGIIWGPIAIVIVVIINAYRGHVLTKVASEMTSNGVSCPTGVSDWWVLENSFGTISRTSVNCFLVIFSTLQWLALLGHATTFIAFAGLSFNQAYPREDWPGISGDRFYIGICMAVAILVHAVAQCFRNIMHNSCSKCICPCLCSAFLLVLLPALCITFIGIPSIISFTSQLASQIELSPSTEMHWDKFILMLTGIVFINGATPDDVTATYGVLRNQMKFPIILIIVSVITIIVGVGFSTAVFLGLDGLTCGSVTFNLPLSEGISGLVRTLSAVLAIVFVSFRHQIDPSLSSRLTTPEIVCDIAFKVIFLAAAGALALGIPSFAGLACLFGSLTSLTLTLTFPFMCDLLLHVTGGRVPSDDLGELSEGEGTSLTGLTTERQTKPRSVMRIIRDVIFILLGLVGMVAGLIASAEFLENKGKHSAVENCAWTGFNTSFVVAS